MRLNRSIALAAAGLLLCVGLASAAPTPPPAQLVTNGAKPTAWAYAAAAGGQTSVTGVTIKAAAPAGWRNYVDSCQIGNSGAAGTDVEILDGHSGTVLWRGWVTATMPTTNIQFREPLRGSAATLLETVLSSGTTVAVYVNCQGFMGP